jgi:Xaa-Pro aminopeptidase
MRPDSSSDPFVARQERLRALMEGQSIPWLLVTSLVNTFYLTGFRGSAGACVFGASEALLWVDPRYALQAREQARGVEVLVEKRELLRAVGRWLRRRGARRVGYEPSHLTCAEFDQFAGETHSAVKLKAARDLVEELREVKDQEEIAHLRDAGRVTAAVYEEIHRQARPGVRESDLAAEIEYRMRKRGAEGAAFETIVASGPRGAFPHARASAKLLEEGELVIFDLGAILQGYAADMTRTVCLGKPSGRLRSLYAAVAEAQRRAVQAIREGVRAGDVDAVARRSLRQRGLERFFTHGTGHGVGLEIHERPRVGRGEKTRLKAGGVITVEPGIYMEGFGGIRVEDTILVGPDGPEVLTPASKDDWILA